jgi:hypothetical protein
MRMSENVSESFRQFLRRSRVKSIVAVVGCTVSILVCVLWFNRPKSEAEAFQRKVVGELTAGRSINEVQQLLGDSEILGIDEVPSWAKSWEKHDREYFPDGVQFDDCFLHYVVSNGRSSNEWYFHFRDGKLVNFDPAWYVESSDLIVGLAN